MTPCIKDYLMNTRRRHLLISLLPCLLLLSVQQDSQHAADRPPKGKSLDVDVQTDVVYGRVHGAGLLADIGIPKSPGKHPVILSVHGGRWKAGHRRDGPSINVQQWAGFGFVAMSIDYRLVECTPVPACYQDLQCAIRFLHANAEQYHIDTERIFLIGQSAGGHMVSLAATLGDGPFPRTGGWEEASNDFRGVISVAANYELTTLSWGDIWTPPNQDPIEARKLASPVNHIRADMKPILILHSDNDQSVPIDNALGMVEALKAAGAKHVFHRYPDMGHMGINEEVIARTREFIDQHR
ncbi:MAG: alpha/beta hydrolase fold domain-containing protein [Planctomycetaceae bacterium]